MRWERTSLSSAGVAAKPTQWADFATRARVKGLTAAALNGCGPARFPHVKIEQRGLLRPRAEAHVE
jgi:hypothetical protein